MLMAAGAMNGNVNGQWCYAWRRPWPQVPMDGTVDVRVKALLKCDALMDGTSGVRATALVECRHGTVEVLRMLCDTLAR